MQYASLGSSIAGTLAQTIAGSKTAKAQQDIYNAEATSASQAGQYNAELARQQGRRVAGKATAAIGASGLATTSGSPLDIMLESAKQAELEALSIRYESEQKAAALRTQGKYAGAAGSSAITSGVIKGSTYFSDWYNRYGLTAGSSKTSPLASGPPTTDLATLGPYDPKRYSIIR